jgi:isopentenyldiphosphate isomerase
VNPDEELVYEVDEDDNVIRTVRRGELTDKSLRHRSVGILCRDPEGRVLVHRRAAVKRVFPQYYDMFVAGMVPAGESYEEAAVRECAEEIGATGVELRRIGKYRYDQDPVPQWCTLYEATITTEVVPQESEVEWFAFLTDDELREYLAEKPFCPDSRSFYERVRTRGDSAMTVR